MVTVSPTAWAYVMDPKKFFGTPVSCPLTIGLCHVAKPWKRPSSTCLTVPNLVAVGQTEWVSVGGPQKLGCFAPAPL